MNVELVWVWGSFGWAFGLGMFLYAVRSERKWIQRCIDQSREWQTLAQKINESWQGQRADGDEVVGEPRARLTRYNDEGE